MHENKITSKPYINGNKLIIPIMYEDKAKKFLDEMKDKEYDLVIKEHKEKRSLDSNAYCWLLCNKIADVLSTDKDSVYRANLMAFGQSDRIIVLEEALESLKRSYKYTEIASKFERKGKKYLELIIYHGSSTYNSKEMSILINGIVQEAQALGIETMTPEELESLNSTWGNR